MANVLVDEAVFPAIADAIRAKGVEGNFTPAQMPNGISNIQTGGGTVSKNIQYGAVAPTGTTYKSSFVIPSTIPSGKITSINFYNEVTNFIAFSYNPFIYAEGWYNEDKTKFFMPLLAQNHIQGDLNSRYDNLFSYMEKDGTWEKQYNAKCIFAVRDEPTGEVSIYYTVDQRYTPQAGEIIELGDNYKKYTAWLHSCIILYSWEG